MGKVLHASKSGYFPFCSTNINLQDGLYISGSLDQIMALYWKVRKWKYSISGNYAGPLSIIGEGEFTPNLISEKEESLVCRAPTLFSNGQAIIIGGIPYPFEFSMTLFGSGFSLDENVCSTNFQISAKDQIYNPLQSLSNQDYHIVGNYDIKIFGSVLSSGTLYSGFPDYFDQDGSCSLIIEPSEYWSYGGTYSTSTGQRL
jgi:hypothetical protein